LLSRTQVIVFKKISNPDLVVLLKKAIESERGLNIPDLKLEDGVLEAIAEMADGDGRQALNLIEIVVNISQKQNLPITVSIVADILQRQSFLYDKSGEEHYNMLSAFHKSLRGSDPDGSSLLDVSDVGSWRAPSFQF
jgi:putative ATPase